MKVAIYARYSSENQREASIEDQFRICREFARKQGWIIAGEYSDQAISGATLMRPGFQAMMAEALRGKVDVVLAEALDRFSRDQEDTAGLFKRLTFAGVGIVTLAEGDITFLNIGLKGTMNAMFLKELADKTRRGLRGRVELGKAGGGQARYATVQKKWSTAEPGKRFQQFVRPKYLFTGMTKCGECGAGFVVYYRDRLGCFGTRERGTCTNTLTAAQPPSRACDAARAGASLAVAFRGGGNAKRSPETGDLCVPMKVVAGAGFEPATFGL